MRPTFWNVDTLYDFMRDDERYHGKLLIPGASEIEKSLEKITNFAKIKNIKVVNIADRHTLESREISETPDFKKTFPEHCIEYTKGSEFIEATNPEDPYVVDWKQESFDREEALRKRNIVLCKDDFDVFKGTKHADILLELLEPDLAVVYGVATNICVDYVVKGLVKRKIQVYVPLDAVKDLPNLPLPYKQWLRKGVELITTDRLFNLLEV